MAKQPFVQPGPGTPSAGDAQNPVTVSGDQNPILGSLNAALAYGDMLVQQSADAQAKQGH